MKKIILHSLVTVLAFGGAVMLHADETDATVTTSAAANMNTTVPRPKPIKATLEARKEIEMEKKEKVQDLRGKIASTTAERKEMRKDMTSSTTDKMEMRQKIASTTREIRGDRKEIIKTRVEAKFGKMFLRYQATIDRETAIMAKINTRIIKIKAAGGATTDAEKFTAEAKVHLDEAQVALDALKTTALNDSQIASSTTKSLAKETLEAMKKSGQELEKHIRSAHQALEKSVGSLKGLPQLRNASSTKERGDN